MSNKQRNVDWSPERLDDALKARGCSLNQLAKGGPSWDGQQVGHEARVLRRVKQERRISPELLTELSDVLNIEEDYLRGKYDWPLSELDETMGSMYRKYYLNPWLFPKNRLPPSHASYETFLKVTLESHGITWARYCDLPIDAREKLAGRLDRINRRLLQDVFPDARFAFDEASYGRDGTPWNTIEEVMNDLVAIMSDEDLEIAGITIS